jgi:hypothetical protein
LESYTPRTTKKDKALRICLNNTQARFEDFISKLHCGEPVELSDKPERWLRIAEDRGYLRLLDGEFTVR